MSVKSDAYSYGAVARALHWSIALLIICLLGSGFLADFLPKGTITIHKATGILVLGLTGLRILWWLADTGRPSDSDLGWELWPSRLVKWGLLALSLAMPLSGWLMSSAAYKPFTMYGLFDVPLLIAPDKPLAGVFRETHETLGLILAIALVLHVGGALRHHFVKHDDILRRMMPRRHA